MHEGVPVPSGGRPVWQQLENSPPALKRTVDLRRWPRVLEVDLNGRRCIHSRLASAVIANPAQRSVQTPLTSCLSGQCCLLGEAEGNALLPVGPSLNEHRPDGESAVALRVRALMPSWGEGKGSPVKRPAVPVLALGKQASRRAGHRLTGEIQLRGGKVNASAGPAAHAARLGVGPAPAGPLDGSWSGDRIVRLITPWGNRPHLDHQAAGQRSIRNPAGSHRPSSGRSAGERPGYLARQGQVGGAAARKHQRVAHRLRWVLCRSRTTGRL